MSAALGIESALALFAAMTVLAALPSTSVFAVSARAAAHGFAHGAATSAGVVVGDIIFILIAIFGLAVLVETLGSMFALLRYLGGAYLIWLGIRLWRLRRAAVADQDGGQASLRTSFATGLLITLGDQKAILFYLGFLPAFVDLATVSATDVGIIVTIAILAVGGVKLTYAALADRARVLLGSGLGSAMNGLAAIIMITVGLMLIFGGHHGLASGLLESG